MNFLEAIYLCGCRIKKNYWMKRRKRLPFKVVSIGNITTGGTGKTPATIALAEGLRLRGYAPVILTRGYRGKAKGPCFVGPGRIIESFGLSGAPLLCGTVEEAGDEPLLMAEKLEKVPVVKCADRYAGGNFALRHLNGEYLEKAVFILDDGFQHWRLYRDLDIVLLDGAKPFGNGRLLPLGVLREPLGALKRADAVLVTKTRNSGLLEEIRAINPAAFVSFSEYAIDSFIDVTGSDLAQESVKAKKAMAFCGIARPESFRNALISAGIEVCDLITFRDHHRYKQADIDLVCGRAHEAGADYIIATEKDMVKIRELRPGKNVLFARAALKLNEEILSFIEKKLDGPQAVK
ncbi:MAG: tetraacyldisaccharide 4'-kinase [Nitrospirae bacterium]|nr:MAG: tetraacyldisaccharide 4'-kinase [Nitrospirota bacterium]